MNKSVPQAKDFSFASVGISSEQASRIWGSLELAIKEIIQGDASQLRFEELYRNGYTLVLHKYGEMLYRNVKLTIQEHMKVISQHMDKCSDQMLLDEVAKAWDHHKLTISRIRDILLYMDKAYCKQQNQMSIYEVGLLLFRDHVIRTILPRLKQLLLDQIYREREGELIDVMQMKTVLNIFIEVNLTNLGLYENDFEKDFLLQTENYFKTEANNFITQNTCADYLKKVETRVLQEEERADTYLDRSTKNKLTQVVQKQLITQYAQRLVDDEKTGCVAMFDRDLVSDMSRMYSLFSREPVTLDFIRNHFSKVIKEKCMSIVTSEETAKNPKQFVTAILDLRSKYQAFVLHAFKQERSFAKCLKESLEACLNHGNRAAQYLSSYVDELLRAQRAAKGMTDQELDEKLNQVISIFTHIHDKDVFEEFYKQHLSQRLLSLPASSFYNANALHSSNTSSSSNITFDSDSVSGIEYEKLMIAKLRAETGHQFTSRLEGMFKDIDLSRIINQRYKEYTRTHTEGCDMTVTVLTTGFWPLQTTSACNLPTEAREACDNFRKFYSSVHSGRTLTWNTSLGQADLRCNFETGRKELVVHTYQMVILMLFNTRDTYTFKEILDITQIPEAECVRHILSLAHPSQKVLKKNPNKLEISHTDTFTFNSQYKSQLYRNKIPLLSKTVIAKSSTATSTLNTDNAGSSSSSSNSNDIPASVLESRKHCVEASIVRIMKSRKTLDHNNLVAEVIRQLNSRFHVEPIFIKQRIEALIEQEYLKRDEENRKMYHYLA